VLTDEEMYRALPELQVLEGKSNPIRRSISFYSPRTSLYMISANIKEKNLEDVFSSLNLGRD